MLAFPPTFKAIPELVKMHELLTGWYRDLVLLDYSNPDLEGFVRTFKAIRDEGRHTIALSASGIYKLRNKLSKFSQQETNFLDEWLDGFLLSRSRIRSNCPKMLFMSPFSFIHKGMGIYIDWLIQSRCSQVCECLLDFLSICQADGFWFKNLFPWFVNSSTYFWGCSALQITVE